MAGQAGSKRAHRNRGRKGKAKPVTRLKNVPMPRITRYIHSIASQTVFIKVLFSFVALWLLFSAGLYLSERGAVGSTIHSYGDALYWSVAAFSTAGIADTPKSPLSQLIGAIWIILGSVIFFGTIVASITSYFMRPVQRPASQIIDTIEYNLERMD
ncbi:MAG: potassium channel family protein, partial [Gammaproteobacteria bacterium]|nr:potassium channel family protein [Gammaproteobacteria bacterium]